MKKITFKEASIRFVKQGRTDILLCKDGWNGWSKKSKFWDNVLNEEWWAIPNDVYKNRQVNLKRGPCEKKRITFEEAKKLFIKQGRTDIKLCKEGYKGWKKKSKFYDYIEQDYFWNVVKSVYKQKSAHPKRNNKKRYEATKKAIRKKYGVDNVFLSPEIQKQKKETCIKRYGTIYPSQNEIIKKKQRQTCLNKYGVVNFSKTKKYLELTSNRIIKETNEYLLEWYKKQPEPKPAYITLTQEFPNKKISIENLETYILGFKKGSISLGQKKLFDCLKKHLTCEIKIEYFFKLSKDRIVWVDIFIPEKNIVIEYYGDYWHCNPIKYKETYFHPQKKIYAKDIWNKDQKRKQELEKLGYKVIIIWENEFKHNKEKIISNTRDIVEQQANIKQPNANKRKSC